MNSPVIQLIVLAGIAIFLILRLRSVLGSREGYEKPLPTPPDLRGRRGAQLEVIEGRPDRDVTDHVPEESEAAKALLAMKAADPSFSVSEFLGGARSAYEMILMAFERGDLAPVKPFLSPDVYNAFAQVVEERHAKGYKVEATFVGLSELALRDATFDPATREAEVSVRFVGELTSVVRDSAGEVVEGSSTAIRRQRDVWTFAHTMGSSDPNWILVATSE